MANVPRQIASRSLDTGSVVSYPSGSPIGSAIEGLGNSIQNVAERFRQKQDQKDNFDATIRENEMLADIARQEDDAVRNAPIDGAGIHDSVYGEIDPVTQQPVRPGSYDTVFDSYLQRMPESKRAEFAAKRELYRMKGSNRLAGEQYKSEQAYYKVEIQKTQNEITTQMAMSDPNDTATFDAFKQQGVDIIEKSGLPALEKDVAKTNWLANADETLFKTLLAKDPQFAAKAKSALGLTLAEPEAGPNVGGGAVGLLRKFEGFRSDTYWDVNAHRLGYGSDTITKADGSVVSVKQGDTVTRADAERDLARRSREFEQTAARQVGVDHWSQLPGGARAALTSVAYNYGSLPKSVASAVRSGDMEKIASAVEGLRGHNGGINAKRRAEEAAIIRGQASVPESAGGPDPRFANIPLERRLVLANQADVEMGERQRTEAATIKADYTQHSDDLDLQIVRGQIRDEAIILNDPVLNSGDKAKFITKVRTQNEGANQIQSDFVALNDRTLDLDPYASKDKTRADNLYSDAVKRIPPEQHGAIAGAILEQTGVVPQPVVNSIRQGLSSQTPADVATALQLAQRISAFDPAALARRDGGSEVQTAVDDFAFDVNKRNLSPEMAAQRYIERNSPEAKFNRKAMEPAAKEFLKEVESTDLSSEFDTWFGTAPDIGFSEAQRLGIQAEFAAIAEDQFYRAGGDPEIARNRAVEEMKRLYGVTELTGRKVVMKHPPERYWPKFPVADAAQSLSYPSQLQADISAFSPDADMSSVQLVTTPETDAMVKRGEMPGYAVLYQDRDGVLQTIPGKLWRPDITKLQSMQKSIDDAATGEAIEDARANQTEQRQQAPYRVQGQTDFLSGQDPVFGDR